MRVYGVSMSEVSRQGEGCGGGVSQVSRQGGLVTLEGAQVLPEGSPAHAGAPAPYKIQSSGTPRGLAAHAGAGAYKIQVSRQGGVGGGGSQVSRQGVSVSLEELRYSPEGSLLTRGPGAYKIPGFQDIPCEFHVSLLKDAPNPLAIFSSKGVGEPPLLLATSVFQAIKDAVGAAREDQGLGRAFRFDSPATAERVRIACQGPFVRKIPPGELGSKKPWSVTV
nr:xanthine dehydrogenase/oxidase-like [Penaeus vannamei]